MGRILFIRVSAETYDEKDVVKAWPALYAAVWPDPALDGTESPARLARKLIPSQKRGVLQLAEAFEEFVRFLEPEDLKNRLKASAGKVEKARLELEAALGDQDVKKAKALTLELEDALDEAESVMRQRK